MVVGVDDCNYYHHKLNYGEPRGPKSTARHPLTHYWSPLTDNNISTSSWFVLMDHYDNEDYYYRLQKLC